MTEGKRNQQQEAFEVKTFTVPFALEEIKENITITSNTPSKHSKEQIIKQAFKFHSEGNILEAKKYYQLFINQGFKDHRVFSNYGVILKNIGKFEEAKLSQLKAIEIKPDFADAHSNLGMIFNKLGKPQEAELSLRKAIDLNPNITESHYNLGIILNELGKLQEAELSLRKATELNPNFAEAYSNLGNILNTKGKLKEAELSYLKAIELNPNFAEAYSNLGNILNTKGKLKEAELLQLKAIELKPDFVEAHSNLGNILRDLGKLKEAELSYLKAIEIKPNFFEAHSNLGNILRDLGKSKEAELSYLKAIEIKPSFSEIHSNLGMMLSDLGKSSDASKHLSSALRYSPYNLIHFINLNLRLSPIMESNSKIDSERNKYKKEINKLKNKDNMSYTNPKDFFLSTFYLAYQNRPDDRVILEDFSDAISKTKGIICKEFSRDKYIAESSKRKNFKIGICSMFLRANHSVGKCFLNVLKDLSGTDIDMTIYIIQDKKNHSSIKKINESFKKVVILPNCPQIAAKTILSDQLDLMFYPDLGMNSFSYILALSRLALVQVTGLGHGSTSGIKSIDYYITHASEPQKSDIEYTETLVRFRRLPFNFAVPKIDENNIKLKNAINSKSRFYIGLIQSLAKIHPSYDEVLESILSKIDNSYLVLITDKSNYKFKILQDRWNKKNKLLIEKSIFINSTGTDDFLNITRSCDIMLDPFYFGGGVTFYEAMAFGIPFITYPHTQKVRIVSAGYEQMKIKNPPIAKSPEDYINWCIKYSKDKLLLDSTKNELKKQAEKYLFNDNEIYKDYYNFFTDSVKKARENC